MKDVQEIQAEFDISRIQAKAAKQSAPFKFISELAEALGIPVQQSGKTSLYAPFYYITENGLSIFANVHKVAIVYQPEDGEAITNHVFPDKDLKLAVLGAYQEARIEVQKNKEALYA